MFCFTPDCLVNFPSTKISVFGGLPWNSTSAPVFFSCIASGAHMPQEQDRKPNRWEGTQTYSRHGQDSTGRRPRTAAQVREEALRRIKEDRDKRNAVAERRRSLPTRRPASVSAQTSGQEDAEDAMPGSNKKKRQASGKPEEAGPSSQGDSVDPALKSLLMSIKEDINKSTDAAVDRIDKRIDEHAKSIAELKKAVDEVDKKIEDKVAECVRGEVAKLGAAAKGPGTPHSRTDRQQASYNYCRRSLKIWPIEGDDLLDALKVFLATKLKFSDERIGLLGHIEVTRTTGRMATDRREALATFESRVERDCVKAAGINLAGQTEVGMAIHVPGFLMDNLTALNGVGYTIKQKQKNVKRAIKFDDTNQDIYMDICIDGQWRKITPTKARQVAKKLPVTSGTASLSLEDLSGLVKDKDEPGTEASNPIIVPDDTDQ